MVRRRPDQSHPSACSHPRPILTSILIILSTALMYQIGYFLALDAVGASVARWAWVAFYAQGFLLIILWIVGWIAFFVDLLESDDV